MAIAENLERVRAEVAEACARSGRRVGDVALMAVSKMHPVEFLVEAHTAGQRLFGENRVQEWQAKAKVAGGLAGLEMHLIGPLQSNKTGKAAELFGSVDTVDSLKVAGRLNEAALALGEAAGGVCGGEAFAGGDEAWGGGGGADGAGGGDGGDGWA